MAARRGRGGRRLPEEEHVNHERWLVTYADMITLLMVLFIVLFAMSTVDQKKFQALKEGLSASFAGSPTIADGSTGMMERDGAAGALESISPVVASPVRTPAEDEAVREAVSRRDLEELQRQHAEAKAEAERLRELSAEVLEALRRRGLDKDIQVSADDRGLVLSLVSRHVVFEPDMASLTRRGREVLDILATVLRRIDEDLQIDGHTNQERVKPRFYPTDWELSAARAVTVLRHLNESGRVPNSRMTAAAFGHEKPLVRPSRPGSQRVNKRVDVVVLSPLSAESRALLKDAFRRTIEKEGGTS